MLQNCLQIDLEKKFLLPRTTNLSRHLQTLQEKTVDFIISHNWHSLRESTKSKLEGEYQNLRLGEYIKLGVVQKVYE